MIAQTPDIAPTFILNNVGHLFGDAAREAGMSARLHGLRKAFRTYRAEQGESTYEIAAMAGHMSLSEVERYTRAADRERMIRLLVGVA